MYDAYATDPDDRLRGLGSAIDRLTLLRPHRQHEALERAVINATGDEPAAPTRAVLFPTDYSPASRCAFQIACRLTAGGRVTVLHAPEPLHVPFGMARPPPVPPDYRGAWQSRLECVRSSDPKVHVDHRLVEGDPATEILRVARNPEYDLVVMGAGRWGGLWWALTESVSRAVTRSALCPVLRVTVPEETSYQIVPRRVLLVTDSREPDEYSLGLAHTLAVSGGEELFALSVRHGNKPVVDRCSAANYRPTVGVSGVRRLVRTGCLVEEVLRMAHDLRPALVLMGTLGRTGIRELFDPARAVRRAAACPVLSVHLPARNRRPVTEIAGRAGTNSRREDDGTQRTAGVGRGQH